MIIRNKTEPGDFSSTRIHVSIVCNRCLDEIMNCNQYHSKPEHKPVDDDVKFKQNLMYSIQILGEGVCDTMAILGGECTVLDNKHFCKDCWKFIGDDKELIEEWMNK